MFYSHKLPDGKTVGISHVNEIIFSSSVVDSLSDDELIKLVRWLSECAETIEGIDFKYLDSCTTIEEAVEAAELYHQHQETLRAKRRLSKNRRTEFQKVRNDLALALIERDGYICQECDSQSELTIDHIMPISKGGSDDLSNLRFLCRRCNSSKSDKVTQS